MYGRSYCGRKEKWIPAPIIKITGPLSYVVKTIDNLEWRRHKNQLRACHIADDVCKPLDDMDFDSFPLPMVPPQNLDSSRSYTSSQNTNRHVPPSYTDSKI